MTTNKSIEELDKLVQLHMDLSARVRRAQSYNRGRIGDPVLPRVHIPTGFGTEAERLVALSELVLAIYDNLGLPADLGIVSLGSLVQDAIEAGIEKPELAREERGSL